MGCPAVTHQRLDVWYPTSAVVVKAAYWPGADPSEQDVKSNPLIIRRMIKSSGGHPLPRRTPAGARCGGMAHSMLQRPGPSYYLLEYWRYSFPCPFSKVMDRRTIIRALGISLFLAAPLAAREKPSPTRRIGVLGSGAQPTPAELLRAYAPLRELGWVEGVNLLVERRYANGRAELLRPYAEELVRLKVELIATNGTDAALAAKNATSTIPIVIWSAGDPVRTGLVASLARPGGNITGYSIVSTELDAKRVALLRELLPTAQRVGVLENSTNPIFRVKRKENEPLYRSLGMQTIIVEVAAANELENAVGEMARRRAQVLVLAADSLFRANRVLIMGAALRYALPTMVEGGDMLQAGGLLSYAASLAELNYRHAAFIDKILRGAKPADLPIEQPTKFELGINLKTAKALGIAIPKTLLLRADEVIQRRRFPGAFFGRRL